MTYFGHAASEVHLPKIAQNGRKKMSNAATVHPERRVFRATPHMYAFVQLKHIIHRLLFSLFRNYVILYEIGHCSISDW